MNHSLGNILRKARSLLILAVLLGPISAHAALSNETDGSFQPTQSVIFNSTQSIFNFTDAMIPEGVSVSFNSTAPGQLIQLLATGNITLAGSFDAGLSDLWIETPGSINLTGTLISNSLILTGGRITINSPARIVTAGNNILSGSTTLIRPDIKVSTGGKSGDITVSAGGCISLTGSGSGCSGIQPVPEPQTSAMLMAGLGLMGLMARRRRTA